MQQLVKINNKYKLFLFLLFKLNRYTNT